MRLYRETELGTELLCTRCGEYWPADREFWFMTRGDPHSWCKACYVEYRVSLGLQSGRGRLHHRLDPAEVVR